jgi:hypothetical protein
MVPVKNRSKIVSSRPMKSGSVLSCRLENGQEAVPKGAPLR